MRSQTHSYCAEQAKYDLLTTRTKSVHGISRGTLEDAWGAHSELVGEVNLGADAAGIPACHACVVEEMEVVISLNAVSVPYRHAREGGS